MGTAVAAPDAGSVPVPRARLGWRASITGAAVVTLVRPASWAVGLAGFLAGGGLLVVAWPIVVLPTPTGLQNALGGPISSLVFGAPSAALVTLIVAGLVAGVALVAAGIAIGAWAERQGIAIALDAAADEAIVPAADLDGAPGWVSVALLRAFALTPVLAAMLLAWRPVYDAAYRELLLPGDLAAPLPLRVVATVPWAVAAIGATWLLADAAASVGVRRLVLERRSILQAWLLGWADLVRRPHRVLGTALAGIAVIVVLTGPALVAAALAWRQLRHLALDGRDPPLIAASVLTWVAVWLAALVLAGVATAFRGAAWTLELPRGPATMDGPAAPADGRSSPA